MRQGNSMRRNAARGVLRLHGQAIAAALMCAAFAGSAIGQPHTAGQDQTKQAAAPARKTSRPSQEQRAARARLVQADLFIAIRDGSLSGLRSALARGADVNGRNWLGITPLQFAALRGSREAVDALLAHHADLNAGSIYGSALTEAVLGRDESLALYLVSRGAELHPERIDKATVLMLAAADGDDRLVERLLSRRDDPNRRDNDGAAALHYAARNGHVSTSRLLLRAGAAVDSRDSHGRTPLMDAAARGKEPLVDLLVHNSAQVNARDRSGASAALLAVRYSASTPTVRRLIAAGADLSMRDSHNASAVELCSMRGNSEIRELLVQAGAKTDGAPASVDMTVKASAAVERSLTAIQTSMSTFASRTRCVSCHHQGLGMSALGVAKQHGFAVDPGVVGSYLQQIGDDGKQSGPYIHAALQNRALTRTIPAVDIGDISIGAGYIFGGLAANGVPSNPGLEEMTLFLAEQQRPNGQWTRGFLREPIQSSQVTCTALALQVLRVYGPKDGRLEPRIEAARKWLLSTTAKDTEERATRLLGLKWAGASDADRARFAAELAALQRADGGWAQAAGGGSDAYATGIALYALHEAGGMEASSSAYIRGAQFLVRTQDEDGSWFVSKRAAPLNTYLDAGFPHGESQYISFGATCWATMALAVMEPAR